MENAIPFLYLLGVHENKCFQNLQEFIKRTYVNLLHVILDELGYVPFSKAGSELLFEVVSRAYERQSLIITTNLPFESWTLS